MSTRFYNPSSNRMGYYILPPFRTIRPRIEISLARVSQNRHQVILNHFISRMSKLFRNSHIHIRVIHQINESNSINFINLIIIH